VACRADERCILREALAAPELGAHAGTHAKPLLAVTEPVS